MNGNLTGFVLSLAHIHTPHLPCEVVESDSAPEQFAMPVHAVVVGRRTPEVESRTVHHYRFPVFCDGADMSGDGIENNLGRPDGDVQHPVLPVGLQTVGDEAEIDHLCFDCRHRKLELLVGRNRTAIQGIDGV